MDKYNTPVFTSLVEISRLANTLQSVMDMGMEDITSSERYGYGNGGYHLQTMASTHDTWEMRRST